MTEHADLQFLGSRRAKKLLRRLS